MAFSSHSNISPPSYTTAFLLRSSWQRSIAVLHTNANWQCCSVWEEVSFAFHCTSNSLCIQYLSCKCNGISYSTLILDLLFAAGCTVSTKGFLRGRWCLLYSAAFATDTWRICCSKTSLETKGIGVWFMNMS